MTIKNILLIFFIILITVYYKYFFNNKENFGEYNFFLNNPKPIKPYESREMVISLTKNLTNPLIFINNNHTQETIQLFNALSNIFPIKYLKNNDNYLNSINKTYHNTNYLVLLQEDLLIKYLKNNNNLRYVCSLFYVHFTLITYTKNSINNWKDLTGKTIITLENSESLNNLYTILNIMNYKKNDIKIYTTNSLNTIKKKFYSEEVDCVYLTTTHPSMFVNELSKKKKIKIITIKELPKQKMIFNFPNIFYNNIDLHYYGISYPKNIIDSYSLRVILTTNYKTNQQKIFNLTKSIFENIIFIKNKIKCLKHLDYSFMSFSSPLLRYHEGTKIYLNKINMINTQNNIPDHDRELCFLLNSDCNKNKINKNRFINDFNKINNYQDKNYTILNKKGNWNNSIHSYSLYGKQNDFINTPIKPILLSTIANYQEKENDLDDYTLVYRNYFNNSNNES